MIAAGPRPTTPTVVPKRNDSDECLPGVLFADYFDFAFQLYAPLASGAAPNQLNQVQHILRGSRSIIDKKISVFHRDHGTADACAFQAQLVNQAASRNPAGFLNMHPALGAAGWELHRFWPKSCMRRSISSRTPGCVRRVAERAMCVLSIEHFR